MRISSCDSLWLLPELIVFIMTTYFEYYKFITNLCDISSTFDFTGKQVFRLVSSSQACCSSWNWFHSKQTHEACYSSRPNAKNETHQSSELREPQSPSKQGLGTHDSQSSTQQFDWQAEVMAHSQGHPPPERHGSLLAADTEEGYWEDRVQSVSRVWWMDVWGSDLFKGAHSWCANNTLQLHGWKCGQMWTMLCNS